MTGLLKAIRRFENRLDEGAERFTLRHPCISVFVMLTGVPIFILSAVAASTTLITLPLAWLFGWM